MSARLVIVCGAPGTGKTTLARGLASALGYVLLAKDDLKEALADRLGAGDRERSRELGRMAFEDMRARAGALLDAGQSVVLEANFHRAVSEPWLRELARVETRVIECICDEDLRRRRFAERGTRGERHPVHLDDEILANEWSEDTTGFSIDIGAPRLVVDTTAGYDRAAVERFARGA